MQLTSYLFFDRHAAEAFDFYANCLGGKITMKTTYGEMPDGDHLPPAIRELIAHIRLEVGAATLMASDWAAPDDAPYPGIRGTRVCLGTNDPVEAERVFNALGAGGTIDMPIAETSWSLRFGMFTDRFGVRWMVNCSRLG